MNLISLLLTFLMTFTPANSFKCDGDILNSKIINNQNGDFTIIKDLDKLDSGAFVVLEWKVNLMLPRTFLVGEKSFSDNKWKWIYDNNSNARLLKMEPNGLTTEYKCNAG